VTVRAGFGAAVITPPLPVALAGFGARAGLAEEVHDDLEARAVWLSSGSDGSAVCLVVCDLLGMTAEFADPVRDAVAVELGIDRGAVLTSCVHTHAGPNVMAGGETLGWATPSGYPGILVAGCVAAARQARTDAEAAELSFARGGLPADLSFNRRGLPYDPTFCVLTARTPRGELLGTLANVSIHPVALGIDVLAVSADWVGVFRAALEAAVGGRAVLLSGALGDVNPRLHDHPHGRGSYEDAARVGQGVAHAVRSLSSSATPVGDGVALSRRRFIDVPASGGLAALAGREGPMSVELIEWQIGSTRLVSVPGEAFHALGRAIEAVRGDHVLLAGLAPVWQGYLPEPFGDGYEESVSYGAEAVAGIKAALTAQ
jgi:hypothetical protein